MTLTATVTADGMPVTSGTVTFTRGSQLIGRAALGADGTASADDLVPAPGRRADPGGFSGNPDDYGSVSPAFIQAVDRYRTSTFLAATTEIRPMARCARCSWRPSMRSAPTGVTPTGTVVFRRNGRVIGRAKLVGGTATLVLPRRIPGRGRFVAQFQGGKRYRGEQVQSLDPAGLIRRHRHDGRDSGRAHYSL